ncbi:unnamed protein product [Fraxinus pennsylvanica]|uniref:Uncharacterized protein n=1 Tax=Fraxinus pennsylvanica TaxID=56036 RepID=A0AAD2E8I3_9LAMI|nr:unnamed protein product [Fraxinus pennsylvanica]
MELSEFTNPLKSIPPEIVPIMPFKSMNNAAAGGMFSSNSGNLFGNTRGIPSSSSAFQLNNGGKISGSSANMSATILLQKVVQIGATSSNSTMTSPMMQKSFVSSMAGSDQLSGSRTSSNLHQNNSFDNVHNEQSKGTFSTQLLQNSPQELSQLFHSGTGGSVLSDMVLNGGMLVDSDPYSAGFLKKVTEQDDIEHSGIVQRRML